LGIEDTEMEDILGLLPRILVDGPMSRKNIASVLLSK
jgi:hypothetical protein